MAHMSALAITKDANLRWIRTKVFVLQQEEFAALLELPRTRLSKYENGVHPVPKEVMDKVRIAAKEKGLPFSADWFFEAPASAGQASMAGAPA